MPNVVVRKFTVGDRLVSLYARLTRPDGTPVILGPAETVAFRMVSQADKSVKVNNAAARIVSRGDENNPAEVAYDWASGDVNSAGTFTGWFIRQSAGQTEHFPSQDTTGPGVILQIIFKPES